MHILKSERKKKSSPRAVSKEVLPRIGPPSFSSAISESSHSAPRGKVWKWAGGAAGRPGLVMLHLWARKALPHH